METTALYLVELERPGEGWLALQGASSRARRAAEDLRRDGAVVRFIRSIYVPEDDACFFLLEATSADLVDEVGVRAGVAFHRVTQPVPADEDLPRGVWHEMSGASPVATHAARSPVVGRRPSTA